MVVLFLHLLRVFILFIDNWFAKPLVSFENKRSASALYVQSHCDPPSNRDKYVAALMDSGISVDSVGKCLHNKDVPQIWDGKGKR